LTELEFNNLFFAIWPNKEVRSELMRIQQTVCGHSGRLHHPEDLHLTLVFLGRVPPERIDCIEQVANGVTAVPFTLNLDRTGYWKRPHIVWCSPEQTPEPLNQLVHDLQLGLTNCGFQPEKRTYKPHVTLARKARPVKNSELDHSIVWSPHEFVLAGSHSRAELPRYTIIKSWGIWWFS
jgi:2'-5' RNA ligase